MFDLVDPKVLAKPELAEVFAGSLQELVRRGMDPQFLIDILEHFQLTDYRSEDDPWAAIEARLRGYLEHFEIDGSWVGKRVWWHSGPWNSRKKAKVGVLLAVVDMSGGFDCPENRRRDWIWKNVLGKQSIKKWKFMFRTERWDCASPKFRRYGCLKRVIVETEPHGESRHKQKFLYSPYPWKLRRAMEES